MQLIPAHCDFNNAGNCMVGGQEVKLQYVILIGIILYAFQCLVVVLPNVSVIVDKTIIYFNHLVGFQQDKELRAPNFQYKYQLQTNRIPWHRCIISYTKLCLNPGSQFYPQIESGIMERLKVHLQN